MSFYKYLKLKEASVKDIEKINPERELLFNNIFGNKLRILISLDQNEKVNDLIQELKKLGYKASYDDILHKIAYKTIKTQQGEKARQEKIGKILQNANKKEWLDWWQKNGDNLKNKKTGSSIIISRSPIDILRMSDHDGISSCHSPDDSFYQCAVQEARTGGAIAYVVKNVDLKGVNLQDKEIFEDKERNVKGIIPLERLRLRRLTNGSADILLPELRTYGISNVNFLDSVVDWAKKTQENIIKNIDPANEYKSFKLKGGSYQDTEASRIWSKFFNVAVTGSKESEDQDEEDEENEDSLDAQLNRLDASLERHRRSWRYVNASVDSSDNVIYATAYAGFSIPTKLFIKDIFIMNKTSFREFKRMIEDAIDVDNIEDLNIEEHNDEYTFSFSINNYQEHYENNIVNNIESFFDELDRIDKNFPDTINKVYKELLENEYIKNISNKLEFKNFNITVNDEVNIETKNFEQIGYLKDYKINQSDIISTGGKRFIRRLDEFMINLINEYKILPFKLKKYEFGVYLSDTANIQYLEPNKSEATINGWMTFFINVDLSLNIYKNSEFIKRLKNLDNNWDFYVAKLNKIFDIAAEKNNLNNLTKNIVLPNSKQITLPKKQIYKLSARPVFKKPELEKQLNLNFKEWLN